MGNKDNLFGSDVKTRQTPPREDQTGLPLPLRRARIQVALVLIGSRLGYTTLLAGGDAEIISDKRILSEAEAAASGFRQQSLIVNYGWATNAASLGGCVWFRNPMLMPAVIEFGDAQTATGSLMRMREFQSLLPPFPIRWVIAGPDEDREKAIQEASKDIFKPLNAKFFSYSAVEELSSFCGRRNIPKGSVNEPFLDAYMESCLKPKS